MKVVKKLGYHETLEQAHTAANYQNWDQLSQTLQQLLLDEDSGRIAVDSSDTTELLNLALQVLEFGSFQDRWEIAKLFPSFGTDAIAPLIEQLNDEDADPEAQWFAVRILGNFNHPCVVDALIEVLQTSENEDLNSMAISALATMGGAAISVLETLLDADATRLLATQALGQIRRSQTVPLLLKVVRDPDAQIRAIAVEALSSFHSAEITGILIESLKDLSVQVRIAAVSGLGFRQVQDYAAVNLATHICPLLLDFNLEVCRQSAIALGRLGTTQSATALHESLKSPHTPEVLALELVRALSWIALPDALSKLESALLQLPLSESIQLEVVQVLGRIEAGELKPQATKVLLGALSCIQSSPVRQAIALSLGQLGDSSALNALMNLSADPDDGVRFHALAGLKMLGVDRVF